MIFGNLISKSILIMVIEFIFHISRGMKFENVSILINAIEELIRRSGFYWIDDDGLISFQERVFRINCMDCLDRTNVVQASIARNILLNIVSLITIKFK